MAARERESQSSTSNDEDSHAKFTHVHQMKNITSR